MSSSQPRDEKGHFMKKASTTSETVSKPSKKKSSTSNVKLPADLTAKLKEAQKIIQEVKIAEQKAREKETLAANQSENLSPQPSTVATKKRSTTDLLSRITIQTESKNYLMLLRMRPAAGALKFATITDIQKAADTLMKMAPDILTLTLESKINEADYGICKAGKNHKFKNDGYHTYCTECGMSKVED